MAEVATEEATICQIFNINNNLNNLSFQIRFRIKITNEELIFKNLILESSQNIPSVLSHYINSIGIFKRPAGKMYHVDRLKYKYKDHAGFVGFFTDRINCSNWLPYRVYPCLAILAFRIHKDLNNTIGDWVVPGISYLTGQKRHGNESVRNDRFCTKTNFVRPYQYFLFTGLERFVISNSYIKINLNFTICFQL